MPTVGRVCIPISVASPALSLSNSPAIAKLIEDDRKDQDDADGHGLEVRLHADEVHAISEDGDEECAKDRPDDPPSPPRNEIPPITAAVIDSSGYWPPRFGSPDEVRAV